MMLESCLINRRSVALLLVWLLACSTLSGGEVEAASESDSDAAIYAKFKAYRSAVILTSAGDSSANVSDFFSNKMLHGFVGAALRQRQNEDFGDTLQLLRGRFKSAGEVNVVYSYSVARDSKTSAKLTLIFQGTSSPEPRTETIIYLFEDNDWRIDGVIYYGFKGGYQDEKALQTSKEVTISVDTFEK